MNGDVTYRCVTTTVDEIVGHHYEHEKFISYCRQCPQYGKTWKCPPFDYNPLERLGNYRYITMVMARITIDDRVKVSLANEVLYPVKQKLHHALLQAERTVGDGYALLLAGGCDVCDEPCSRVAGQSCRHPSMVRPSLEGWGINVTTIASDIFATPIEWSSDGFLPRHTTLVGALLHNDTLSDDMIDNLTNYTL